MSAQPTHRAQKMTGGVIGSHWLFNLSARVGNRSYIYKNQQQTDITSYLYEDLRMPFIVGKYMAALA